MLKTLAVALVVVSLSASAFAADWVGGDGNWATGANWSTGAEPTAESAVIYDVNATGATPTVTVNTVTQAVTQIAPYQGATLVVESGGTLTVNGDIYLGRQRAVLDGTMIQNANTAVSANALLVQRFGIGVIGTYEMKGGTLDLAASLRLGADANCGAGLFHQTGGTVTLQSGAYVEVRQASSEYRLEGGLLDFNGGYSMFGRDGATLNWTGGTIQGLSSFSWGSVAEQDGGLMKVGIDSAAASMTRVDGGGGAASYTVNSGTVEFDASANGVNDVLGVGFNSSGGVGTTGNLLDISNAAAVVQVSFSYAPQAGDSFDLVDVTAGNTATLSAGNVAALGIAGLSWDTSAWESDGVLTVVPEPATMSLLILGGFAALIRRRK